MARGGRKRHKICLHLGAESHRLLATNGGVPWFGVPRRVDEEGKQRNYHYERDNCRDLPRFELSRQIENQHAEDEQYHEADRVEQLFQRYRREDGGARNTAEARHEHNSCRISAARDEHVVETCAGDRGAHRQGERGDTNGPEEEPPADALYRDGEEVHEDRGSEKRQRCIPHRRPRRLPVDRAGKHHEEDDDRRGQDPAQSLLDCRAHQTGRVANSYPCRFSSSMIFGRAAAVCKRSPSGLYPSPSCRSTIEPGLTPSIVRRTISSTPGRSLSHTPSDHPTV